MKDLSHLSKASLKTNLASWKDFRQSVRRKNRVWKSVMQNEKVAHVVNKVAEKRVFFESLKRRGLESKSLTSRKYFKKGLMKKVLGDIEHSGEFSHREMHILGEELIGGVASKRIDRSDVYNSHASEHLKEQKEISELKKPESNMQKIYQEILDKSPHNKIEKETSIPNFEKPFSQQSKKIEFLVSDKNLRNVEPPIGQYNHLPAQQISHSLNGYIPNHLKQYAQHADINKVKSMLAEIQDKGDNIDEDELENAA